MDRTQLKIDLEIITQARPVPASEALTDVLTRLDAVAAEPGLPRQLEHYLSKRSYQKALVWLDDPETPHRA